MDRPLYNQLVSYYELIEGRDWRGETNLIASILNKHHSKSIVDLGCGTGYHVRALSKLGFKVTGIDISRQNIRFARKKAKAEGIAPSFFEGSYYNYRPNVKYDAALCLNWSIPVRDAEVRRFLNNTSSLLVQAGLLIFDFEKVSQIVWDDVGKPFANLWDLGRNLILRVSVGKITSNILRSKDFYIIFPNRTGQLPPTERARYEPRKQSVDAKLYVDNSFVRFFSMSEIRNFARDSKFTVIANFELPRSKYKRNYAVLKNSPGTLRVPARKDTTE
jgi:2-polyprenyl-3-methyl-5-hydroxy-6-metoxy-1,4-benzoquinol methylase